MQREGELRKFTVREWSPTEQPSCSSPEHPERAKPSTGFHLLYYIKNSPPAHTHTFLLQNADQPLTQQYPQSSPPTLPRAAESWEGDGGHRALLSSPFSLCEGRPGLCPPEPGVLSSAVRSELGSPHPSTFGLRKVPPAGMQSRGTTVAINSK